MKKSVMLAVVIGLLCFSTTSYAKNINKGTIEVGGGSSFSKDSMEIEFDNTTNDTETDSMSFSVHALYYIRPNIGVGGMWKYDSEEEEVGQSKTESSTNMFGPMISYNVSINQQTSFQLTGGVVKISGELDKSDIDGHSWVFKGQLNHFLNKNVAIYGSAGYNFGETETEAPAGDIDSDMSLFSFGAGLSFYLDFDKIIRKL